jgi:FHA domain-containing protein/uncharacterized protein DUF1707
MAGSAAEAPTMPDAKPVRGLRASDAERDEVVAKLAEEFAAGRLSHDTFLFRMNAVLQARHQSDLPRVLADLPEPGDWLPPLPLPWPGGPPPAARRPHDRDLASRLRGALRRLPGYGGTASADSASRRRPPRTGLVRRLTGAMPSAAADRGQPAPLQFPRAAGTEFSIGRNAGCDLAITDPTVSRVHARLERTPDGWLLCDLGSTNGTRVNGWLVRGQVPVRPGDLVSFGMAEYRLLAAAEGA